ncbi:hypothetical protein BACCAP_01786 [Pseudoflavonifractor capillosus ATCC 29799]|uniref:Uncharacterized protein n=1 Tax=Pseudoflavonifractor capillosus ATCC 29799 TaxID=411467 RepID=A6NUA4_9FIRM|nr:hypothetical protein BACCAP_01786 [Pseudoflavonifractor capillosus ATCC 29799]
MGIVWEKPLINQRRYGILWTITQNGGETNADRDDF